MALIETKRQNFANRKNLVAKNGEEGAHQKQHEERVRGDASSKKGKRKNPKIQCGTKEKYVFLSRT